MINLQYINTLRKEKKLKWDELSEKIGISTVGLRKIINTNSTKIETLQKISDILEVDIREFFTPDSERSDDQLITNTLQKDIVMFSELIEFLAYFDVVDVEKIKSEIETKIGKNNIPIYKTYPHLILQEYWGTFDDKEDAIKTLLKYKDDEKYKRSWFSKNFYKYKGFGKSFPTTPKFLLKDKKN